MKYLIENYLTHSNTLCTKNPSPLSLSLSLSLSLLSRESPKPKNTTVTHISCSHRELVTPQRVVALVPNTPPRTPSQTLAAQVDSPSHQIIVAIAVSTSPWTKQKSRVVATKPPLARTRVQVHSASSERSCRWPPRRWRIERCCVKRSHRELHGRWGTTPPRDTNEEKVQRVAQKKDS